MGIEPMHSRFADDRVSTSPLSPEGRGMEPLPVGILTYLKENVKKLAFGFCFW